MPNGAEDHGATAADPSFGDARGFADALRQQTQGYVEQRKADAARVVSDVARAIRDTGSGLEALPQLKPFLDQAALGVDDFADGIARRSFGEMYDEVQAAIRRRPGLAAAAAVLAGFGLFRAMQGSAARPVSRSRQMVVPTAPPRTPDR